MDTNTRVHESLIPSFSLGSAGESAKHYFRETAVWCNRKWHNLSTNPFLIETGKTILFSAPFAAIDILFPQYSLIITVSFIAITLLLMLRT